MFVIIYYCIFFLLIKTYIYQYNIIYINKYIIKKLITWKPSTVSTSTKQQFLLTLKPCSAVKPKTVGNFFIK